MSPGSVRIRVLNCSSLDANSCPQIIYYGYYRANAGLRLKKGGFLLGLHLEMCYKMNGVLKAGYLMLGALSNTFKVPVNGYDF